MASYSQHLPGSQNNPSGNLTPPLPKVWPAARDVKEVVKLSRERVQSEAKVIEHCFERVKSLLSVIKNEAESKKSYPHLFYRGTLHKYYKLNGDERETLTVRPSVFKEIEIPEFKKPGFFSRKISPEDLWNKFSRQHARGTFGLVWGRVGEYHYVKGRTWEEMGGHRLDYELPHIKFIVFHSGKCLVNVCPLDKDYTPKHPGIQTGKARDLFHPLELFPLKAAEEPSSNTRYASIDLTDQSIPDAAILDILKVSYDNPLSGWIDSSYFNFISRPRKKT